MDVVGSDLSGLDQLLHLCDADLARLSALGVEVARSGAEYEISVGVALPGLDQRKVARDGLLHHVVAVTELAGLAWLAFDRHSLICIVFNRETTLLNDCSIGCGCVKSRNTST